MLPRHVRVQRVAGLGHRAAQHAAGGRVSFIYSCANDVEIDLFCDVFRDMFVLECLQLILLTGWEISP